MRIGMIGLGRMGGNMARRLMKAGIECVGYSRTARDVEALSSHGGVAASSAADLAAKLPPPRTVWLMIPAAAVDGAIGELLPHLNSGDVVIDGGNSYYVDDLRRARDLAARGIDYVDVGVSGGVWGLERGYCLMIGGPESVVARLDALFAALAPGPGEIPRTPGREKASGTAEQGYLHCGPSGAGHFVKMVHNGIEYGLMAAYAEGLNILHSADAGHRPPGASAEVAPLRHPEHYQYDFDLAAITEVWRRGSVIASWLLDLTAAAMLEQPDLSSYSGKIADSGEGRWTLQAAIDVGAPAPVLADALFTRFSSRAQADFANRVLAAMRHRFGGHGELPPSPSR
jgi:6-phosphogluconate dehydrogenase